MGLRDEWGLREGSIEKCSAAKKTMAKRGYGSRRGRGCKWYITSSDYIGRKEKGLIIISCMHIAYIPDTVTSKSGFERKLIPLRSTAAISLHRWFLRLTAGATNRQLLYQVDSWLHVLSSGAPFPSSDTPFHLMFDEKRKQKQEVLYM